MRIPGAKRRITRVWDVAATTGAITALADELVGLGIERVVLEATSDYWRSFFYLLEARGLCVWLVNAKDGELIHRAEVPLRHDSELATR